MGKLGELLFSDHLKEQYKVNPEDFSRRRKQSFSGTVLFILNLVSKSLSIEIENFIAYCNTQNQGYKMESFTKSAFVQYRKKIKPFVFESLSKALVDEFYTDNESAILRWKGFRLLAIDGSHINLPNTEELKKEFGVRTNQSKTEVPQARCSVLYDVLNHYALDASLSPLKVGEPKLAVQHLKKCNIGDLVLFDRGYTGFPLIYELDKKKIDFVIRAKHSFNRQTVLFSESKSVSEIVEISPGQKKTFLGLPFNRKSTIKVRLVKVILSSGEVEFLITSLLDDRKYPNEIFKELYFERWKIETYYDELKNKLQIENFTGYSKQVILQDFLSTIFVSNIQTLIVTELNDELKETGKVKRYDYKINKSVSYGLLKNNIISIFISSANSEEKIEKLKELLKKHQIPIRPNRSSPRDYGKYRKRTKPKVTKNQKNSF